MLGEVAREGLVGCERGADGGTKTTVHVPLQYQVVFLVSTQ